MLNFFFIYQSIIWSTDRYRYYSQKIVMFCPTNTQKLKEIQLITLDRRTAANPFN